MNNEALRRGASQQGHTTRTEWSLLSSVGIRRNANEGDQRGGSTPGLYIRVGYNWGLKMKRDFYYTCSRCISCPVDYKYNYWRDTKTRTQFGCDSLVPSYRLPANSTRLFGYLHLLRDCLTLIERSLSSKITERFFESVQNSMQTTETIVFTRWITRQILWTPTVKIISFFFFMSLSDFASCVFNVSNFVPS